MTMTLLDAIDRVREALDELASALASGEPANVLAAEEPLGSAVSALAQAAPPANDVERAAVPRALHTVKTALKRCETLGRTADDFVRAVFPDPAYGRRGLQLVSSRASHFTSRT
jgi:hypothetical protein